MQLSDYRYILLTGATASGKSTFAMRLAEQYDAVIVNCDSMQIYKGLEVLTAAPTAAACLHVDHLLYGYVNPGLAYSVGDWLADVSNVVNKVPASSKIIFVGGTGLYFNALLGNLAVIPKPAEDIREKWRSRLLSEGSEKLYKLLQQQDGASAQRIAAGDGHRIVRALEVLESSGKPLSYWQGFKQPALISAEYSKKIVLTIERQSLYDNIEKRCEGLVANGALGEVQRFADLQLSEELPAMHAIGVVEFMSYLAKKNSLQQALAQIKTRTKQYAKRQLTWQRHQLDLSWQSFEV